MKNMRKIKILVDAAMFVLFLYLMGYRAGSGLWLHGVLGMALFALFLLHHVLNLRWYRALRGGKYPFARKLFIFVDFLFLADMAVMGVSAVLMSGEIFWFSPVPMSQFGRELHTASTAWGFLLMALHLGLHTHGLLTKLERKAEKTIPVSVYKALYGVLLAGGCLCFFQSGLWRRMFLLTGGENAYRPAVVYGRYLFMILGGCLLVHLILAAARKGRNRE